MGGTRPSAVWKNRKNSVRNSRWGHLAGHRGSVGCITLQVMASRVPSVIELIRRTLQRIEASPESRRDPAAVETLKKAVVLTMAEREVRSSSVDDASEALPPEDKAA
jgi:hypothetical protein